MEFHWADYLVLSVFLAISASIGFFVAFWTGNRTTSEYLLGGRKLNLFPVAVSIWVTLLSAVSVLGTPLEVYLFGPAFLAFAASFLLSVPLVAHLFVPFFFKLKLTSVYEYLELRFNRTVRLLGSIVFCLQMVFYMAIVLYAPSLALSQVTHLSMWISILGLGIICTAYTALGGLRAVVYTDTFQAGVIMVGVVTLIAKGVADVGGFAEVWRRAGEGGRLDTFIERTVLHNDNARAYWLGPVQHASDSDSNFDPDPRTRHTVWSLTLGGAVTTVSLYGINQAIVQRYMAVSKVSHAQAAVYINLPANVFSIVLFVVLGLVAYARYFHCDPLLTGRIKSFDQLIPLMVMDVLGSYPGLPGLFVACIFSASLSTVSSGLNAMALVYLEDGVKPLYAAVKGRDIPDATAVLVTKGLALVFGCVTIGLAYLASMVGSTLVTVTISSTGMTGGPLLGLFLLAMFFPCANSWGAGTGLLVGLSFSFWVGVGTIMDGPKPSILPLRPVECLANATALARDIATTTTTTTTTSPFIAASTTLLTSSPSSGFEYEGLGLYELSYMWYGTASAIVVIVIGLLVSALTGCNDEQTVNPAHVILVWPWLKKCFSHNKKRYDVWMAQKKHEDKKLTKDYMMYPDEG